MSAEEAQQPVAAEEVDDVPALENVEENQAADDDALPDQAQRRTGKQGKIFLKAMTRFGAKPEPNILRAVFRKAGGSAFIIDNPESYRFPNSNTFVLFGDIKMHDPSEAKAAAARAAAAPAAPAEGEAKPAEAAPAAEPAEEVEESAEGLQEKEIDIVMAQANTTRNKAIRALRSNNGDIVNAIMELTM